MPRTKIKICGLSDAETVSAAVAGGTDYLGFVFFEPSPRHISYEKAKLLGAQAPNSSLKVALTVNANDQRLDAISASLAPDYLQLHGDESPERLEEIKKRFDLPLIKAIKIRCEKDLDQIADFANVADMLLFDAKMPDDAVDALPGGNGVSFDWSLLADLADQTPFMLSGGLNPDNVALAISTLHPATVDVSSGVERAPGIKDIKKIRQFIDEVKLANRQDDAA